MDGAFYGLMDVIVVGCGVYLLYAYYLLTVKHEIKQGVLISQKTDPKKCKDFVAYEKYISPKLLLLGIAALISGGIGLYQDYVAPVSNYIYGAFFVLFFVIMAWYIVAMRNAEKRFW